MSERPVIGFIGVGTIGQPMALNVVKAGYRVAVFDVNAGAIAPVVAAGARGAGSIADAATGADVVITMLPDAPDVEAVALGEGGLAQSMRAGSVYVDMSTIDPGTTRRVGAALAAKGIAMIDAPVARSVEHARRGQLAVMLGGDADVIARVRPILETMADTITHCGALGNGVAMKLVNNFLSFGIVATVSEAIAFGMKAGLPLETILEVSGGTGTNNFMMHQYLPKKAFADDFALGFKTTLARKDCRLALTLAREGGVETPIGQAVYAQLGEAAQRHPNEDFCALVRVREEQAGIKIRLRK